jgi:FKBP-type peptidyl-prolyl cis-trans isomerase
MKRALWLACLLLFSCVSDSTYKRLNEQVAYQLLEIGEQGLSNVKKGDYITARLTICNANNDTLFFQPAPVVFPLITTNEMDTVFSIFAVGDSVATIWENPKRKRSALNAFVSIDTLTKVRVSFRILAVRSKEQFKEDSLFYVDEAKQLEVVHLKAYLKEHDLSLQDTTKGIYFLPIRKGTSLKGLQRGLTIQVAYVARFLDGRVFDATDLWKEPFVFEYGLPLQVIEGMENGLSLMNEGDEAKIIIPSHLAFGGLGSSNGRVPPFTTVVYQLRLTKIY